MGVDTYIKKLRDAVSSQQPSLLSLFEAMAAESVFAREWLADDIARLPAGSALLEIGGGTFILGCLLAEEGFAVTSIEPVGEGFGEFAPLAKLVLENSVAQPKIAPCRAEDFTSDTLFDLAFSVNVMEHVDDVSEVIARVCATLKPNAAYRFFCPNYLFPYEPHFNIPLILNKGITHRLLHRRIHAHPMHDAAGTWESLNWINVPSVRKVAARKGLRARFDTTIFSRQLERVGNDPTFAARRGGLISRAVRLATQLRLHRLLAALPPSFLPTMDVTLTRASHA